MSRIDWLGEYDPSVHHTRSEHARVRSLLGALLAVEWEEWDDRHFMPLRVGEFQGPWCPMCQAEVNNVFPGDQKHADKCSTDQALKAIGLPDQASRDAARVAVGQRLRTLLALGVTGEGMVKR